MNGKTYDPTDGSRLMTLDEYKDAVEIGNVRINEGYGHPLVDDIQFNDIKLVGAGHDLVPIYTTHVAWYAD